MVIIPIRSIPVTATASMVGEAIQNRCECGKLAVAPVQLKQPWNASNSCSDTDNYCSHIISSIGKMYTLARTIIIVMSPVLSTGLITLEVAVQYYELR